MIEDDDPNIVHSSKSLAVVIDGYRFQIDIYRLETDTHWTLEVIDCQGTSHTRDDQFATEQEARAAALTALEKEGAVAFMRSGNVVPFRRPSQGLTRAEPPGDDPADAVAAES